MKRKFLRVLSLVLLVTIISSLTVLDISVQAADSYRFEFEDYIDSFEGTISPYDIIEESGAVKGKGLRIRGTCQLGQESSISFPGIPAGEYKVTIGHKSNTTNRGSADISFNGEIFKQNYSFIGTTANAWVPINFDETVTFENDGAQIFTLKITFVQGILLDYIIFTPVEEEDDEDDNDEPEIPLPDYCGEDDYIATDFNIQDQVIMGVLPNTKAQHFLYRIKVKDSKNTSELIGKDGAAAIGSVATGMKLNIKDGSETLSSYTVIVFGDVNGDGTISAVDLLYQKQKLMGKISLSHDAELASNVNHDDTINSADLLSTKQALLGLSEVDQKQNEAVDLIFDTDMMTDCDDMAALAMVHNMMSAREVNILAMAVTSRHKNSAPVVDTVNTYYNRPYIEIGTPKNGLGYYTNNSKFLDTVANEFPHSIESNDDAPDAVEVYRKALAAADDHSVTILTIGYSTNVASLMKSEADEISELTGLELVEKKVLKWVNMGGNFPNDNASDNVNFTRDAASAYYAITNWPIDLVFVGREIGHNIFVGDDLYNTPTNNPVRRAYQLHRGSSLSNWNHHTADPSALLYAVRGEADYFTISNYGYIDIKPNCSFTWKEDSSKKMRYVFQKMNRTQMGQEMEQLMVKIPGNRK